MSVRRRRRASLMGTCRTNRMLPWTPDVGDLILTGWVLVQPAEHPPGLHAGLPQFLLTISDCIQADLPRPEDGFSDWFIERAAADVACHSIDDPTVWVATIGMHPDDARILRSEYAASDEPGFALLDRGLPLPRDADVLGYEVVGAEHTLDFHSWHCHGYADDVRRELGICVNPLGLLRSLEDARAVRRWMLELPSSEAPAPVPWTVVAIASDHSGDARFSARASSRRRMSSARWADGSRSP